MENKELIERFYKSFQAMDGEAMARCYHPDVEFEDPVFGPLKGGEAGKMWRMLTKQAKDLSVEFSDVEVNGDQGSCRWVARYTFSRTGRMVENKIEARFKFRDNAIIDHRDHFDFYRWARQAFGPVGWLIGWTKFFKTKVSQTVLAALQRFR